MSDPISGLDAWLRGDFVRINTALEEEYFKQRADVIHGRADIDALKLELLRGAAPLMEALAGSSMSSASSSTSGRTTRLIASAIATTAAPTPEISRRSTKSTPRSVCAASTIRSIARS